MAEKVRVHTLAKALNVTSKDILEKCQAEGIDVKNHMSTLTAGLEATVREWFSDGAHLTTVEKAKRVDLKKVRKKRVRKVKAGQTADGAPLAPVAEAPLETAVAVAEAETRMPAPDLDEVSPPEVLVAEAADPAADDTPLEVIAEVPAADTLADKKEAEAELEVMLAETVSAEPAEPPAPAEPDGTEAEVEAEAIPDPIKPAGPQNVPMPAKMSGPRVVRYEAPEEYAIPKRGPRPRSSPGTSETGGPGVVAPAADAGEGRFAKGRGPRRRTPIVDDRDTTRRRNMRRSARSAADAGEKLSEWNDQDLAERRERLRGATGRRMVSRRAVGRKGGGMGPSSMGPISKAQLQEPIMVKHICAAIGVPFQRLFPILHKEHNLMLGLTSTVPKEVAELIAASFEIELTVVEAKTGLDQLKAEHEAIDCKNLEKRPPIVTVLGHVDHGKTSLLDYIRRSRVAAREDGGITQHISSYHLKRDKIAVTFLDTPGHEAFTALRARGAHLTDVVVLVIAADDGVMPQTIEAINHAKAAGVPVVVALNKIDLGTQNLTKIFGQLAEHGLTPSGDWGGETDVIRTSATTGEGVDVLLEHLSTLAEVHDYKADPTIPATGTVVEAESRQGVGPVLQAIVRDGTVSVGEVLVCGNSFGKVRAIRDDRGKSMAKAGPSLPVEIWGMNEVPVAGDHFYVVDNLQRAKEIAEEVRQSRQMEARSSITKARSLDDLVKHRSDASVNELNVIIKGDVDGSVSVLASSLEQFPSDEVKLNVLHAGVGAVTDSNVHLGDASNAIIIAFRVAAPSKTRKLAEAKGVDIRHYKVIYDVTDDIKQALEGLLAPDEIVETRGTIEVREVFRISKVGLVAGSYVQDGTVASSHFARVIRNGVVVRDQCRIDSLRRFKDDVKEVRNGMECGVRLEGFDDLKVGDSIESFEIVKVARKLA